MSVRSKLQQPSPHIEISDPLRTLSAEDEPRPPSSEHPTQCSQAEDIKSCTHSGERAISDPATKCISKQPRPGDDSCSAVSVPCCLAAQPCPPPVRGINQVVLVLQPDESTQYMLFSEDRALRDAAAEQAALEAQEKGLVNARASASACHACTESWHLFTAYQWSCAEVKSMSVFHRWCQELIMDAGSDSISGKSERRHSQCCQNDMCTGQLQVPCDPRDAAVMQAIENGDMAVRRVFQWRLRATLSRRSQSSQDAQHAPRSDSMM